LIGDREALLSIVEAAVPVTGLTIAMEPEILKKIAEGIQEVGEAMAVADELVLISAEQLRLRAEALRKKVGDLKVLLNTTVEGAVNDGLAREG